MNIKKYFLSVNYQERTGEICLFKFVNMFFTLHKAIHLQIKKLALFQATFSI